MKYLREVDTDSGSVLRVEIQTGDGHCLSARDLRHISDLASTIDLALDEMEARDE